MNRCEALCAGWRLRLIDSAGLRQTDDAIERAGQDLVRDMCQRVDVVITLAPADAPADDELCAIADIAAARESSRHVTSVETIIKHDKILAFAPFAL